MSTKHVLRGSTIFITPIPIRPLYVGFAKNPNSAHGILTVSHCQQWWIHHFHVCDYGFWIIIGALGDFLSVLMGFNLLPSFLILQIAPSSSLSFGLSLVLIRPPWISNDAFCGHQFSPTKGSAQVPFGFNFSLAHGVAMRSKRSPSDYGCVPFSTALSSVSGTCD